MKNFRNTQNGDSELGFILVVIIIIFLIWLAIGGSTRQESQDGRYIVPLNDTNNPGAFYN